MPFRSTAGAQRPSAAARRPLPAPRGPPALPRPLPLIHGGALLRGTLCRARPSRLTPCQGTPHHTPPVTAGRLSPPAARHSRARRAAPPGPTYRHPRASHHPAGSSCQASWRRGRRESDLTSGARSSATGGAAPDWLAAAGGRVRARGFCSGGGGGGAMAYVPGQPVTAVVVRRGRGRGRLGWGRCRLSAGGGALSRGLSVPAAGSACSRGEAPPV